MHPWLQTDKQRQWILSVVVNTVLSVAGVVQMLYWLSTGDVTSTSSTEFLMNFLYAYLVADLLHNGWYFGAELNFLEFWAHHIIYLFVFDGLAARDLSGVLRGLYILELPSAVRAWGSLVPAWRSDAGFGALFFIFRVIYPFYVLYHIYADIPWWGALVIAAAQGMHIYWFGLWCKGQVRRLREITPPIIS